MIWFNFFGYLALLSLYSKLGSSYVWPSTSPARAIRSYRNSMLTAVAKQKRDIGDRWLGNEVDGNIFPLELTDEVKSSFMSYALSTILGRALPDVRDGLKPVHRRVLYAMYVLNLLPSSSFRKCARVVGEVLGKYHPHGDQSVYDALVRMAQDFVMIQPLVLGHGNFGSVDDDPPAAMRYTESKLSHVAFDALLADINDECVDFIPNFDGSEIEPKILPAKLPLLLINGASGIAVGMATNIPPHNLKEVVNGLLALIENPRISDESLMNIIPAPDFPTGGKIVGYSGSRKLYTTGNGGIVIRAKVHVESSSVSKTQQKSRTLIVITEIPYMVNKALFLSKIAELVNDKKLEGISDIRDESDRDGIRVVIELKRDSSADVVINNLYKKTQLQTSFSGNLMAIVNDGLQPKRLTLRNVLNEFLRFRFTTVRRRTQHRLNKAEKRLHLVKGLLEALKNVDSIISLVRKASTAADAKTSLMVKFGFSEEQADAILGMKLGRLSSIEESTLVKEQMELDGIVNEYNNVLSNDSKVYEIISGEIIELREKYGQPRKTEILNDENLVLKDEDLVSNERCVILISEKGYVKRLSYDEFDSQSRGGKGKSGMRLDSDTDTVTHFFSCNSHDSLLFVTNKGIAFKIKAFNIPISSRTTRGSPLPQILPITQSDMITAVIPIDNFSKEDFVVLLTSQGFIKRTPVAAFENVSSRGLVIISLRGNDSLRWVRQCRADDEILVATRHGLAARLEVNDLPSTGRSSMGLQALTLRDSDEMADVDVISGDSIKSGKVFHFLAITEKGFGKRITADEFRLKRRRGAGVTAIKFKDKAGGGPKTSKGFIVAEKTCDSLRCMRVCFPGDEIAMSTEKGAILRQKVDDLSIQSRLATGVLVQKLSNDDSIQMIDVIPASAVTEAVDV